MKIFGFAALLLVLVPQFGAFRQEPPPAAPPPGPLSARDLGSIGVSNAGSSDGLLINNAGAVVGTNASDVGTETFYWTPAAGRTFLRAVGTGASLFGSTGARAMNASGQVVGGGVLVGGGYRTFLWDPVGGLQNLGLLDGDLSSQAVAINSSGQVAGISTAADGSCRAFRWDPVGGLQALPSLGGMYTAATAINSTGVICGYGTTPDGYSKAVIWDSAGLHELPELVSGSYSNAAAINDAGQVAGSSTDLAGMSHAVLWDPIAGIQDLSGPSAELYSYATAINSTGQVSGNSGISGGSYSAFFWDPHAGMQTVATMMNWGTGWSEAKGLNDAGQVTGNFQSSDYSSKAFRWSVADGLVDLGPPGASFSSASGINASGQVVGSAVSAAIGNYRATLWDPQSGPQDLGTTGVAIGYAVDINASGQVAGYASVGANVNHAFFWDSVNGMQDLGTLPGTTYSTAAAINALGQVAGNSDSRGFIWSPGTGMVDLGLLPDASSSSVIAMNDAGQIVGTAHTPASYNLPFLWDPVTQTLQPLGLLPGTQEALPLAINGSGQVVGVGYLASGFQQPFRWDADHQLQPLDLISGGRGAYANGINASGVICGFGTTSDGSVHAIRWDADGLLHDLGTLPGGTSSQAMGINASGQIVGFGASSNGQTHAILWDPVSGIRDLGTLPGGTYSNGLRINALGQVLGFSTNAAGQMHGFVWDPVAGMIELGTLGGIQGGGQAINDHGVIAGYASTLLELHPATWQAPVPPPVITGVIVDPSTTATDGTYVVEVSSAKGGDITLSATAESSAGGTLTYDWTEDGVELGSGPVLNESLPVGLHSIVLTVTDANGVTSTRTFTIIVEDHVPPVIDADGIPWPVTLAGGPLPDGGFGASFVFKLPQVDDLIDTNPLVQALVNGVRLPTREIKGAAPPAPPAPRPGDPPAPPPKKDPVILEASGEFPFGTTVVVIQASDFSGNIASTTFTITVVPVLDSIAVAGPNAVHVGEQAPFVANGIFSDGSARVLSASRWAGSAPLPQPAFPIWGGAAVLDGAITLAGGGSQTPNGYSPFSAAVFTFNGQADGVWTPFHPLTSARQGHVLVAAAGKLYVIGGLDTNSGTLNLVEVYDSNSQTWRTCEPMPTARQGASAAVVDGVIYVIGGELGGAVLPTVEAYDTATGHWSTKAARPYAPQDSPVVALNGLIYAMGGSVNGLVFDEVDLYDPVHDRWRTGPSLTQPRALPGYGVVDGKIYLLGGGDPTLAPSAEVFDPVAGAWAPTAPPTWPHLGGASVVLNDTLYEIGGSGAGMLSRQVDAFTPGDGVVWSSDAPFVTIDPAAGIATAAGLGSAVITATAGDVSGSTVLSVISHGTSLSVSAAGRYSVGQPAPVNFQLRSPDGVLVFGMLVVSIDSHVVATLQTDPTGAALFMIPPGALTVGPHDLNVNFDATGDFAGSQASLHFDVVAPPASLNFDPSTLTQVYTGTSKSVSVFTTPQGLDVVTVLYDGSSEPPINAGSYTVTASLSNQFYSAPDVTAGLYISQANPKFNPAQQPAVPFGTPQVTLRGTLTLPSGPVANQHVGVTLNTSTQIVTTLSDGSFSASFDTRFLDAGPYPYQFFFGGDQNLVGTTFTGGLTVTPLQVDVALGNLRTTYTGAAQFPTVLTSPQNVGVTLTYVAAGGVPVDAPTDAGTYQVTATLNSHNYFMLPMAWQFRIDAAPQSISFDPIPDQVLGMEPYFFTALSSSLLPVSFSISGLATLTPIDGVYRVTPTGPGAVTITAHQDGTNNYLAADPVARTFQVTGATAPATVTITGGPEALTTFTTATFTFTSSPAGPLQRSIDGGVTWTPVSSPETLSNLSNGAHTYQVRLADGSAASEPYTWVVDNTPPSATLAHVYDTSAPDIHYQSSTTTIVADWEGFSDPESGIASYEWAIGTTSGGTQTLNWVPVGNVNSATFTANPALVNGKTYYVSVRAINGTGLLKSLPSTSPGVKIDTSAPKAGTVFDGANSLADIQYQTSQTLISATWKGFSDPQSGILNYSWSIGTTMHGGEILPMTLLGLVTNQTATVPKIKDGTKVYVTVEARNSAGKAVAKSSNGVIIDSSAPVAGAVKDGTGADLTYQSSLSTISANWAAFTDPDSGIAGYEWAIQRVSDNFLIQGYVSTGTTRKGTAVNLSLADKGKYRVLVRATNKAGLQTVGMSDGVTVDTSAPVAGTVSATVSAKTIKATWTAFTDGDSLIAKQEWAIGTTPYGSDVLSFTNIAVGALSAQKGSLAPGTYWVSVRATNGAGLVTTATTSTPVKVQ